MSLTLRPFDWRDLPALFRYRERVLFLDAALPTTQGPRLNGWGLLAHFSTSTDVFTWVCANDCDDGPLMGQLTYDLGAPFARLAFLAPADALESPSLIDLVEQLAILAGEEGAYHLLAEIDEQAAVFEILREVGFGVYARQRIWRLANGEPLESPTFPWRAAAGEDAFAAQALYHNLVPGLVQQIEPLAKKQIQGLVCEYDGQLIGYVNLKYGHRGIWAQPFIHPDVEDVDGHLRDMLASIPDRRSRPLFLCVRSYQSWLENSLESFRAEAGPMQAVLVKRLAVQHKVKRPFALPTVEGQPEASAPIARARTAQSNRTR